MNKRYLLVHGIFPGSHRDQLKLPSKMKFKYNSTASVTAFSSKSDLGAKRRANALGPVGACLLVNLTTGRIVYDDRVRDPK